MNYFLRDLKIYAPRTSEKTITTKKLKNIPSGLRNGTTPVNKTNDEMASQVNVFCVLFNPSICLSKSIVPDFCNAKARIININIITISKLKKIQSSFINFFIVEVLKIELLAYLGCFE